MKKKNRNYDVVSFLLVLITFMMISLSVNIFFINNKVIVARAESNLNETSKEVEKPNENFFIHIINKSMSILEINYKENGGKDTNLILKDYISKSVNIDYNKPESLIKAQIPMINDVESEIDVHVSLDGNEDYDTHDIYDAKEILDNASKSTADDKADSKLYQDNNLYKEDIQVINLDEKNDEEKQQAENNPIEIVSTPVPAPKKIEHQMNDPLIFIYHTHGTESYKPETIGNYHSLNRKYTVIRVGEILKENLEKCGFKTIQDDTIHDHPSFEGSYSRSLGTLNKNLKTNPSLKIVFDVHRDGINQIDELEASVHEQIRDESCIVIDGKKVARYSIVIGGGNENIEELKQFAYYIKAISDEMYPGLATKIIIKESKSFKYKFNQYKSDYYALFEIGSNANTIEEAEGTAEYLSQVINQALRKFVIKTN